MMQNDAYLDEFERRLPGNRKYAHRAFVKCGPPPQLGALTLEEPVSGEDIERYWKSVAFHVAVLKKEPSAIARVGGSVSESRRVKKC